MALRQSEIGPEPRVFCEPFAAPRLDTEVDDLDEPAATIVRTWLEAMSEPPAT